jgi:hypothetical protein
MRKGIEKNKATFRTYGSSLALLRSAVAFALPCLLCRISVAVSACHCSRQSPSLRFRPRTCRATGRWFAGPPPGAARPYRGLLAAAPLFAVRIARRRDSVMHPASVVSVMRPRGGAPYTRFPSSALHCHRSVQKTSCTPPRHWS